MKPTSLLLALLATVEASLRLLPFKGPSDPLSTIENDGSTIGRFDVRKTMVWVEELGRTNCHFFLAWITTTDGHRYHSVICPCLVGNASSLGIFSLNDLESLETLSGSGVVTGSGSPQSLDIRSQMATLTAGPDNFTDLYVKSDWAGFATDLHLNPTGKNIYIGGSGGIGLPAPVGDDNFERLIPGWTWYWGNPAMRIEGSLTINNKILQIDSNMSFAYYERQWGVFDLGTSGYYALWLYFPNGDVLHSWVLGPDSTGRGTHNTTTVMTANGLHEVVGMSANSSAGDIWVSDTTGLNYFNEWEISMPMIESQIRFTQFAKNTEITSLAGPGPNISEAYLEGEGMWKGKPVQFYGHVEQLSAWRWQ